MTVSRWEATRQANSEQMKRSSVTPMVIVPVVLMSLVSTVTSAWTASGTSSADMVSENLSITFLGDIIVHLLHVGSQVCFNSLLSCILSFCSFQVLNRSQVIFSLSFPIKHPWGFSHVTALYKSASSASSFISLKYAFCWNCFKEVYFVSKCDWIWTV